MDLTDQNVWKFIMSLAISFGICEIFSMLQNAEDAQALIFFGRIGLIFGIILTIFGIAQLMLFRS